MSDNAQWVEELDVKPGDHIIAIVTSEEEATVIGPYVAHGLKHGNTCCIVASQTKVNLLKDGVSRAGVDVDRALQNESFLFVDPEQIAVREQRFDADLFIEQVIAFADAAAAKGVQHVQNCGAMSFLTELNVDPDEVLYLEARLNEVFKDRPISGF